MGEATADQLPVDASADARAHRGPPSSGRSPRQLAWSRLRRDRVAIASAAVLTLFVAVALLADVIAALYGHDKDTTFPELLDVYGYPLGVNGGMSGEHWLGIEPIIGRDVLLQVVYGTRTSLGIAVVAATVATMIGAVVGAVAGYLGGRVDAGVLWCIDVLLAFPFIVFALAAVPIVNTLVTGTPVLSPAVGTRIATLICVLIVFGWMGTARIVRGQVLSLRERQFVDAARVAGGGARHIVFRELLPNLWGPIIVTFSLAVPGYVTAGAALSFLNIGVTEPVPDLGRMIFYSVPYARTDWTYAFFPGVTLFLIVLAANLLGDSLRDALDPKAIR